MRRIFSVLRYFTRPPMLLTYGVVTATAVYAYFKIDSDWHSKALTNPETAHQYLVRCHELPQPYQKAIEDCTQAIQRDAKLAGAYEQRGWLLKQVGKTPQAIADYQQALALYRLQGNAKDIRRSQNAINTITAKGN